MSVPYGEWGSKIPSFSEDGGEEPEIGGCYVNDLDGTPCRLGFAIGNEWSDHVTEKTNYLWLAPSKLRSCSLGPELVVTEQFRSIRGRTRIYRGESVTFVSGEFRTGERAHVPLSGQSGGSSFQVPSVLPSR